MGALPFQVVFLEGLCQVPLHWWLGLVVPGFELLVLVAVRWETNPNQANWKEVDFPSAPSHCVMEQPAKPTKTKSVAKLGGSLGCPVKPQARFPLNNDAFIPSVRIFGC